jgi:hypothetical protein
LAVASESPTSEVDICVNLRELYLDRFQCPGAKFHLVLLILNKNGELNKLRIINQYEVGEGLGLSSKQTDEIVDELRDARMIKKIAQNKIVLSPQALYVIHKNEKST